jgi:hypothetical protein
MRSKVDLNEQGKKENAFLKYEISPVMWSNRSDALPELID